MIAIDPRTPRRIRLVFSNVLASGAFTSTAFYTVVNTDGAGGSPTVRAALIVAGAASQVELVLSTDLVSGGFYTVSAIAVPSTDLSVTTGASVQAMKFGLVQERVNVEPVESLGDILLYGRDLVWNGQDFVETANGDLATVSGASNARQAILRRVAGSPLPWDPTYSPNARSFIDGPATATVSLKGALIDQCLQDDRVKSVKVTLSSDEDTPEEAYFTVEPKLIGGHDAEPIRVAVS
jgi:hypothetical protein